MRTHVALGVLSLAVAALAFPTLAAPPSARDEQPPVADAGDEQAQVPVKQVVLFSSGVGYFEHFGTVEGDGTTELRFKTQQINDILKSLVLQDIDGGRVTTITYPSQDPIEKTLRSFEVDITSNPGLPQLLNQLRGARVTLSVGAEKVSGTILGVERKEKPVGDGNEKVVETWQLNLVSGEGIRSVPMEQVGNIALDDPELRKELEKALEALSQARDQDKKPVTISFRGEGERRVRIGYVVETPIWKTSYRLIVSDAPGAAGAAPKAGGAAKPQAAEGGRANAGAAAAAPAAEAKLQGWAIVENQTDSDWNDVQLSLVSGRPISFIQDLYRPLYIPRPVVQPELFASLMPQTYSEGLEANMPADAADFADDARANRGEAKALGSLARRMRAPAAPGPSGGAGGAAPMEKAAQELEAIDAAASVASVASATDLGELFQYTVGNVSLPRQKSAMIPIVTDAVNVERLSIYNANVLAKHPLNGARVKNSTGKHLLQGPITVLDGGTYAGDARIDDVPPGQERLISYGVDQQLRVDGTSQKQESSILTGKIVKGVLQLTRKTVFTQDYVAQNKGERDKTLLIEHARRQGWSLTDSTPKPIETTEQLYRFQGKSPAGKQTKLTVTEQVVQGESIEILPADFGTLQLYSRTGEIPKPVRDALVKAMQLKQAMAETERQIQLRHAEINQITQEQARIRENLKTVQPNTDYYNRLAKKLNEQETRIETLQSEIETHRATLEQQRKALEEYVMGLNVG